uniref:Uncharacterized protein n=1 Tax=Rhizophora mucronata TaxID=61149 RepID=A0A2P2IMB0_RHIMU
MKCSLLYQLPAQIDKFLWLSGPKCH